MSAVITFEDECPRSEEEIEMERDKYFNWADTYQNPLSEAYKHLESVRAGKSILFHVALKQNWSLRSLARDPARLSPSDEIIISGADLKLDADFSYKLSQQVDLTTPYHDDYIAFSIKAPGRQVNPNGFIDVFSPDLWLWLWLSAAICTGLIHAVSFSFITRKFELKLPSSLAFILKTFILEGHYLKGPKPAVQVFASLWSLGAFVTSTMYVSLVVSSVLSPSSPPPTPETLKDVVKSGMKTTTVISQYNDVINFLDGSASKTLKKLARTMSMVRYPVNCLDAAARDTNTACVAKFRVMQGYVESKYIDKTGQPRLLIPEYRSPVIWTGHAVRKESPIDGIISIFIDRATAAGLVDNWTKLYEHSLRRWGIGMAVGDGCSNQPYLWELWDAVGTEANKNNPHKHIPACVQWNLTDYAEIVKKGCIKIDTGGGEDLSSLDSMLRVEHLFIVFQAMLFLYSVASVCFILELKFARMCINFILDFWASVVSWTRSVILILKSIELVKKS